MPTSPHEGLAETPQEKLAKVRAGISQVRGLDFIEPVEAEYLTTHELTDYLQGLMGEDEREELRQLDELLTLLGLIDTDVDLVNLYLDLLYEGVLGAYDSEEGRLVVRLEGDALGPGEELTLAHELTHALQQQHFDIDSILEETGDNFDRGLAVTALAEGDATLSELLYLQANSLSVPRVPDMPVYNSAPAIIQDLLIFPYASGLRMLTQNFGEEDWSDVNAAYEDPPRSTEQVIHPEKYLEGETPLQVALPEIEDVLGPSWALMYSSVGGEFLLRHYLGLQLRTGDVDEAASGWGGDAFALYGDATDQRLLLWSFRWDSTDDAEEFFEGYAELTENEGGWSDISKGASYSQWGRPNRWVYLQGSGDYVSVIIAPSRELTTKLAPLLAHKRTNCSCSTSLWWKGVGATLVFGNPSRFARDAGESLEHLRIQEMPSTPTQLLVTALAGWADAGEAATAALRRLSKQFDAKRFADLDPEEFYDFSQVRPYTSLTRDGLRRIRWPANELFYSPTAMSDAGALLFLGVEPSLKWRTYAESIVDLGKQCGVTKVVHIGALLDAVPHTREILLTGSSNNKDMIETLEDHGIRSSRYQGPTGITSALMEACSKRDISFTTLWGHAPHYLHAAPNYTVSHALVKALSDLLMASMDLGELSEASVTYHEQVSSAVIEDSQLSSYIEKLEDRYDSAEMRDLEMPQPEEVLRDLEDFLKERQRRFGGGASDD